MDPILNRLLKGLPALDGSNGRGPDCKICQAASEAFDAVDFYKHCGPDYRFGFSGVLVPYYRCTSCLFIFTNFIDTWSNHDLREFIYNEDYLKIDPEYVSVRAIRTANSMASLLESCKRLRMLDYGSGSGAFTREMAQHGYSSMETYDPLSSPSQPAGQFDLITCFEVIEHSPLPVQTFEDLILRLSDRGALIVGQTLQPENIEDTRARWWYIAPRNGHVSIYSEQSLLVLANRLGLNFYRGTNIYAFARPNPLKPIAQLLGKFEALVNLQVLYAPREGDSFSWHVAEATDNKLFRWSCESRLLWQNVQLRAGLNRLQIPYVHEIYRGFAASSSIVVDGKRFVSHIMAGRIQVEVNVKRAQVCRIELVTPTTTSPLDFHGTLDARKLGIAVECAPS